MRHIIFHLHLFKNAGSSFDNVLKESFPGRWQEKEFRFTRKQRPYDEIENWIRDTPDIRAYSSHTARLPMPEIDEVNIIPVLFIRHPLIRLYSGYRYEVNQDAQTPGAIMAKKVDFGDYIRWRIRRPLDSSIRNFQANRLTHLLRPERGRVTEKDDMEALALEALNRLPFIGFVEKFELSLQMLAKQVSRYGLELKVSDRRDNVNSDLNIPTEDRIAAIREDIGDELFQKYCDKNAVDLKIYEIVRSWYGVS